MNKRSQGRELATLALFADFIVDDKANTYQDTINFVKEELFSKKKDKNLLNDETYTFAQELCEITFKHLNESDKLIKKNLKNYDFKRINIYEKTVLRLAIAELLEFKDLASEVIISEAVKLAFEYSLDNGYSFVNAILASVLKELRPTDESQVFDFGSYDDND